MRVNYSHEAGHAQAQDGDVTSFMRIALEDLALDHLTVIYPGTRAYPLGERITVLPLAHVATERASVLAQPPDESPLESIP